MGTRLTWSKMSLTPSRNRPIDEMRRRGTPFAGLLYVGLALTSRGLRVVEFNARFGDPETQVVLERLQTPARCPPLAAATQKLADFPPLRWMPDAAVTVVIAAEGYPESPHTGDPIEGLDCGERQRTCVRLARRDPPRRRGPRREFRGTGAVDRRDRTRRRARACECVRGGRRDPPPWIALPARHRGRTLTPQHLAARLRARRPARMTE